MTCKTVIYLVANDRYFYTHRLALGLEAQKQGYNVIVAGPALGWHTRIEAKGLTFTPITFDRGGLNPFKELQTLRQIIQLYRRIRPQVVHHVALKPALLGTLAARLCKVPRIINAVSGLGEIFTGTSHRLLRSAIKLCMGMLWRSSTVHTLVQNPDDQAELESVLSPKAITLVYGAGVDLAHFTPQPLPTQGPILFTLASRMLWTKGVKEFVEAIKALKAQGLLVEGWLVGEPDLENRRHIPRQQLQAWHDEGSIIWHGFCEDMAAMYARSHVAVLPSYYREGIPKTLIEAAACGRALIATQTPGCNIVVEDGTNGLLIPPQDTQALKVAMTRLMDNARLQTYGHASRMRAQTLFGAKAINQQTLALYSPA
jgi:glycosyltransferase involved in cell wall biosynthesis